MSKLCVLLILLCGCSYVHEIGTVGNQRFIKVQAGSLTAPAQTLIVVQNTNDGAVQMLSPASGNGILSSATMAAGTFGAGYYIGRGLGKADNSTTVHQDVSNDSASQSEAESTSSPVITVPDAPPAPPIIRTRPPFKWGHSK